MKQRKRILPICCFDGRDIRLELDPDQIFPDDPGQGTPALVILKQKNSRGSYAGTWNCVINEGEVDGIPLTDVEMEKLLRFEEEVNKFLGD